MDVRRVPLSELDLALARLRQLPEVHVREKTESLRRKGQLSPLVAAEQDGTLVLVDGFIRHQAAMRLGLESLLVDVVHLAPAQMKAQVYLRNRERGLLLLEECRLVQELCNLDGLSQVEVADLLERHKSWVCRRLALYLNLSPHLLVDQALGCLPGGALRRLAQLQPRNQELLMAAANRDGLPSQDVGALADLYRRAPDPLARNYLLEHPRDALALTRRPREKSADPQLGNAGNELLASLTALRQLGLRLMRHAHEGLGPLSPEALARLNEATDAAERDCTNALTAARQCLATA